MLESPSWASMNTVHTQKENESVQLFIPTFVPPDRKETLEKWRMESLDTVVPREFLCCKLCGEEYDQPKHLPCLHSFCSACLAAYAAKPDTPRVGRHIACPICGTTTRLSSSDGLSRLPDNVLARRLSCPSIEAEPRDKICITCLVVGRRQDAARLCINCDDFLCRPCAEKHQAEEETSSHKLQDLGSVPSPVLPRPRSPVAAILEHCCQYYDAYDIGALYCVDCEISLCADCHETSHENHRCAEHTAIAANFEKKIKNPLSHLKKDVEEFTEALAALDVVEQEALARQQQCHQAVRHRTQCLHDLIQQYETMLLNEIDKRVNHCTDSIQQQRVEIKQNIASITVVTDLTDKLLTYGSDEEKICMRKKIGRRVRTLYEGKLLPEQTPVLNLQLSQPEVTVEMICNLFGELVEEGEGDGAGRKEEETKQERERGQDVRRCRLGSLCLSQDSGRASTLESTDNETEFQMPELEDRDSDALSSSNTSDFFTSSLGATVAAQANGSGQAASSDSHHTLQQQQQPPPPPTHLEVPAGPTHHGDDSESFNSSLTEEAPSQTLDLPSKEVSLPSSIHRDCIKGIGINAVGDIVVGTVTAGIHMIHVMEKHGIIRGQRHVERGWNLHSVHSDGKVVLTVARGDNRYKIRVLSNDGTGSILSDVYLESFGLNWVTANSKGQVLLTSNRYAQHSLNHGKAARSGGNVSIYDPEGCLLKQITNDDFVDQNLYLLEKPQCIHTDLKNNFYVTDPGSHVVSAFSPNGDLIFEYGNTDTDGEIYQGPDFVTVDAAGNVIVTDKREGRIDLLSQDGILQKCFFSPDAIRFVSVTPDKLLMVATAEGNIKFFDYL